MPTATALAAAMDKANYFNRNLGCVCHRTELMMFHGDNQIYY